MLQLFWEHYKKYIVNWETLPKVAMGNEAVPLSISELQDSYWLNY